MDWRWDFLIWFFILIRVREDIRFWRAFYFGSWWHFWGSWAILGDCRVKRYWVIYFVQCWIQGSWEWICRRSKGTVCYSAVLNVQGYRQFFPFVLWNRRGSRFCPPYQEAHSFLTIFNPTCPDFCNIILKYRQCNCPEAALIMWRSIIILCRHQKRSFSSTCSITAHLLTSKITHIFSVGAKPKISEFIHCWKPAFCSRLSSRYHHMHGRQSPTKRNILLSCPFLAAQPTSPIHLSLLPPCTIHLH